MGIIFTRLLQIVVTYCAAKIIAEVGDGVIGLTANGYRTVKAGIQIRVASLEEDAHEAQEAAAVAKRAAMRAEEEVAAAESHVGYTHADAEAAEATATA